MSSSNAIEPDLDDLDVVELQRTIREALRLYAAKADRDGYLPIVPQGSITATEAMIAASALLKSVNIAVFELGLWESWGGVSDSTSAEVESR